MIGTFILRCGEGTGMKNLEKHKFSTEMFYTVVCKSSCIQLKKIQFRMCYLIGQPNFIFDGSCLWWIVMCFIFSFALIVEDVSTLHPSIMSQLKSTITKQERFRFSLIFYSQISIRFIRKNSYAIMDTKLSPFCSIESAV